MFQQQKIRREQKLAEDKEFLKEIDRFEEKNEANRIKARLVIVIIIRWEK